MLKNLYSIIKAFVENTPDNKTQATFEQWLTSDTSKKEKEGALEELWNSIPAIASRENSKGWKKLSKTLFPGRLSAGSGFLRYLVISAAAVLVIGLFIAQHVVLTRKTAPVTTENTLCYVTAKDSKGEFTLPDGTTVWLNGSSKLFFPERLEEDIRKVRLEGEAFFDVKRDTARPFIVDMINREIEVLGTSFDVKNYPNLTYQEIVLVRGSVNVHSDGHDVILKPNEKYTATVKDGKEAVSIVDTEDYSHWMDETLRFDNRNLGSILVNLGRWYNFEFDVEKTVNLSTRLSFNVKYESIDEVMRAVSMVTPIRYHIDYENNIIHVK
ncbi:MAG: FecR domain-containing protein [Bacteroidales bacterium]